MAWSRGSSPALPPRSGRRSFLGVALALALAGIGPAPSEAAPTAEAVRAAQELLTALGYRRGAATGSWDEATITAVNLFADDQGVNARVATTDPNLPLLRASLTSALARRGSTAPELLLPTVGGATGDNLSINQDGSLAVSQSQTGLHLWDVRAKLPLRTLRQTCCLETATMSAGGSLVAYASGSGVFVRDAETDRVLAAFEVPREEGRGRPEAKLMRFAPDNGSLVVADSRGRLTVYGFDGTASLVGEHLPAKVDASIYGYPVGLALTADGRLAATLDPYDGAAKIWDLAKRSLVRTVKLFPPNPDGRRKGGLGYDEKVVFSFDASGRTLTALRRVSFPEYGKLGTTSVHRIDVASGRLATVKLRGAVTAAAASVGLDVVALSVERPAKTASRPGERPAGGPGWPAPGPAAKTLPEAAIEVYDLAGWKFLARLDRADKVLALAGRTALVQQATESGASRFAALDLGQGEAAAFPEARPDTIIDYGLDEERGAVYLAAGNAQDGKSNLQRLSLAEARLEPLDIRVPEPKKDEFGLPVGEPEDVLFRWADIDGSGRVIDASAARVAPPVAADDLLTPRDGVIKVADPRDGSFTRRTVKGAAPLGSGFKPVKLGLARDRTRTVATFEVPGSDGAQAFVSVVDLESGREVRRIPIQPLTRDPIGLLATCAPGTCPRDLMSPDPLDQMVGMAAPVAFSADGKLVYAGFFEPMLAAYEVETGRKVGTFDLSFDLTRFNPEARIGEALSDTVNWERPVADRVARANSIAQALAPVPGSDAMLAVLGASITSVQPKNFMVRLEPGSLKPTRVVEVPGRPNVAVVSPDGSKVALGYGSGDAVIVGEGTGEVVAELKGSGEVGGFSFSRDGRRVFTRTRDGRLQVWRAEGGRLLATIALLDGGRWAVTTPEGFYAAAPGVSDLLLLRTGVGQVTRLGEGAARRERPDLVQQALAGDPQDKLAEAAATLH